MNGRPDPKYWSWRGIFGVDGDVAAAVGEVGAPQAADEVVAGIAIFADAALAAELDAFIIFA